MGVGVPFAIGAKLAAPNRTVISINGDCAFGFNAMELETSLRHRAPVVFVVDNNDGIAGQVLEDAMFQSRPVEGVAAYLPGIHYEKLMEAFGGYAEHITDPVDLRLALERALSAGRSACLNVAVDPQAFGPITSRGEGRGFLGY